MIAHDPLLGPGRALISVGPGRWSGQSGKELVLAEPFLHPETERRATDVSRFGSGVWLERRSLAWLQVPCAEQWLTVGASQLIPPLLPPAPVTRSRVGAIRSAGWQIVAAPASRLAYSHPSLPPSALSCYVNARYLVRHGFLRAGKRQNAREKGYTPSRATLLPVGMGARHRLVQNARSRSNSLTASLHPEC